MITTCNPYGDSTTHKRIEGALVTIDGKKCGNMPNSIINPTRKSFEEKIVCPTGLTGSKVKITNSKTANLHLAEVEVYYFGTNNVDTKFCPKMFNGDGSYNKQECKACMTGTQCSEMNVAADKALCNLGCDFIPENVETVMGVKGVDYRGKQTKTKSGKTCQAWNVDVPNNRGPVTPEAFAQADL